MNNFKINIVVTVLFFLPIIFSSCKDSTNITEIDSVTIPSANVSFSQYILPVLYAKCARAGCHDDAYHVGGLSLTTWANTTSSSLIVLPGTPQNSKLVWSIEGTGGNIMPPLGYPALTKNQIDGIKIWIKEGAKNN